MKHRVYRSRGVSVLYREFEREISRRDLGQRVREAREEIRRSTRHGMERIIWHVSRICWSMDDITHVQHRLYSHQVQDLGSKYRMPPKSGDLLCGREVAENLRALFKKYGPPLFMKRDNGGNLNDHEVDDVLSEFMVIPFNSPPNYPRYNGSMERGQQDIHDLLADIDLETIEPLLFAAILGSRVHELNATPRPCLGGQPPYTAFFQAESTVMRYDRRRRKEVHTEITDMAARIVVTSGDDGPTMRATAWRVSVKNWLRRNGVITVTSNGRVLPDFP